MTCLENFKGITLEQTSWTKSFYSLGLIFIFRGWPSRDYAGKESGAIMGLRGKWRCDGLVMSAMNLSGPVMVHVPCTDPSRFKVLFHVSPCSDSQLNCPSEPTQRYMQPNILSMTEVQREVS